MRTTLRIRRPDRMTLKDLERSIQRDLYINRIITDTPFTSDEATLTFVRISFPNEAFDKDDLVVEPRTTNEELMKEVRKIGEPAGIGHAMIMTELSGSEAGISYNDAAFFLGTEVRSPDGTLLLPHTRSNGMSWYLGVSGYEDNAFRWRKSEVIRAYQWHVALLT